MSGLARLLEHRRALRLLLRPNVSHRVMAVSRQKRICHLLNRPFALPILIIIMRTNEFFPPPFFFFFFFLLCRASIDLSIFGQKVKKEDLIRAWMDNIYLTFLEIRFSNIRMMLLRSST